MDQMELNFHAMPEHRDYKTRNCLTIEERVKAIREYERNPIYQRVAEKFNCSAKQIKNIIANKEELLAIHSHGLTDDSSIDLYRKRSQKIEFLGKVIYEYIQRAVYHNQPISAQLVRKKALDIKECIAIENFYPNNFWMQNFQNTYNLADFNLESLRKSLVLNERKKASLNNMDLIQYISQNEKEQEQHSEPFKTQENIPKFDSEDEDLEMKDRTGRQIDHSPALADIHSYEEALHHLKVLEDFAMLKENYRAIGLITQLEEVFKKPLKPTDFEV